MLGGIRRIWKRGDRVGKYIVCIYEIIRQIKISFAATKIRTFGGRQKSLWEKFGWEKRWQFIRNGIEEEATPMCSWDMLF